MRTPVLCNLHQYRQRSKAYPEILIWSCSSAQPFFSNMSCQRHFKNLQRLRSRVEVAFLLLDALTTLEPADSVLGKLLNPRLQLRVVQAEVVDRSNPHCTTISQTVQQSVADRTVYIQILIPGNPVLTRFINVPQTEQK